MNKETFKKRLTEKYYHTIKGGRAKTPVAHRKEIEVLAEAAWEIVSYEMTCEMK